MKNQITALLIEPHKKPEVIQVENNFKAFNKIIGGQLIEPVIMSDTAAILIDEEGKLKENRVGNRRLNGDILVGNMLIVGTHGEHITGLSEEDIALYSKMFSEPEEISDEEIEAHSGFTITFLGAGGLI